MSVSNANTRNADPQESTVPAFTPVDSPAHSRRCEPAARLGVCT